MLLTRRELPILFINLLYIPIFAFVALRRTNYEFLLYVGVIIAAGAWVMFKQRQVRFSLSLLWGLTVWGLAHMIGGLVRVGEGVVYGVILLPIFPSHNVLRYDHVVHAFGFGMMTLLCFHVLRPYLRRDLVQWRTIGILVVLMSSGVGALNEIIEFVAVLSVPETGVGGYQNTMLDLVFNLLGGIVAGCWIILRQTKTIERIEKDGLFAAGQTGGRQSR